MFDIFENYAQQQDSQEPAQSGSGGFHGDVFVVSVGGSLFFKARPDTEKIREFARTISSLRSSGKKFVLVVGGGRPAREYVEAMASAGANNFEQDLMGIKITRANALIVAAAIPEAHREVLTEITRAKEIIDSGKIPVFGGLMPFFTTDAVGALISEFLGATFVNLTNVDGIYDADPSDFPDAKRFEEISYEKLISLILESGSRPGQNVVLDLACCLILQRSSIKAVVLDGNSLENFSSFVNGSSFTGTLIGGADRETDEFEPARKTVKRTVRRVYGRKIPARASKPKRKTSSKRGTARRANAVKDDYEAPDPYKIDY